jgi:hypothetical protein
MKNIVRWGTLFAVLALPAAAFAATHFGVLGDCCIPGCPFCP